jgi:hypothetical protein
LYCLGHQGPYHSLQTHKSEEAENLDKASLFLDGEEIERIGLSPKTEK